MKGRVDLRSVTGLTEGEWGINTLTLTSQGDRPEQATIDRGLGFRVQLSWFEAIKGYQKAA